LTKVTEALQYLQDPDIPFIATNTDNLYPVKPGQYAAGMWFGYQTDSKLSNEI